MELIKGFSRQINDQFTIKIATDNKDDFEKILELNVIVHGEPVKNYFSRIFWDHPRKDQILCFYIEDNKLDKAVSSISLLPLEWKINGIVIPICEMGYVGTLEDYRSKNFISELNKLYELAMAERGYIISVIRGIPYYYRKLGYEFALPLDNRMFLAPLKIPSTQLNEIKLRKVESNDIDFIGEIYNKYYQNFYISNKFDKESYIFKYFNNEFNDFKSESYIIENDGKPVAHFTFGMSYDNLAFDIKTTRLNEKNSIKLLQFIKEIHGSENKNDINICTREDTDLGKHIIALGGIPYHDYAWQIKIPNLKMFINNIKLILENRINNSIFKGLTQDISISNYKETIILCFNNGHISKVKIEMGYTKEGSCDLQVPGSILYKILLGDRTPEEINYIMKDVMIKSTSKGIIKTLFPKKNSYPDSYY